MFEANIPTSYPEGHELRKIVSIRYTPVFVFLDANGRKVLDFVMSNEGQAIWANAYLRPVRAAAISKEAEARFLPATEYARAKPVDYAKMADVQKAFTERWLKEIK